MGKRLVWLWGGLLGAALVFFWVTYGGLPERVATHFDAYGRPNGYQGKGEFLIFFLRSVLGINGIFAALYFLADRIPVRWMNLPNRSIWLSRTDGGRELTYRLRAVAALLGAYCSAVLLLTLQIIHQENVPSLAFRIPVTAFVVLVLCSLAFLALFLLVLLRPPEEGGGQGYGKTP